MSESDSRSAFHKQLDLLRREFAESLTRRSEKIERLWSRLPDTRDPRAGWRSLVEELHKLRGVAGTYGFPELSEQAAELERAILAHREDGDPAFAGGLRERIGPGIRELVAGLKNARVPEDGGS